MQVFGMANVANHGKALGQKVQLLATMVILPTPDYLNPT